GGPGDGYLRPGGSPLSAPDRATAVPGRQHPGGAPRRDDRRAGAAAPTAAPPAARPGGGHAALPGEGAYPSLPQRPGAGRRPGAIPGGEARGGAAGGVGHPAGPRGPASAAGRAAGRPPDGLVVRRPGGSDLAMEEGRNQPPGGRGGAGPGQG